MENLEYLMSKQLRIKSYELFKDYSLSEILNFAKEEKSELSGYYDKTYKIVPLVKSNNFSSRETFWICNEKRKYLEYKDLSLCDNFNIVIFIIPNGIYIASKISEELILGGKKSEIKILNSSLDMTGNSPYYLKFISQDELNRNFEKMIKEIDYHIEKILSIKKNKEIGEIRQKKMKKESELFKEFNMGR